MPSMLYVIQKICSSSAVSINTPKTHTSIIRSEASSIKKGMLRKLKSKKKEFGRKIRRFSCFKNNTTKKDFFSEAKSSICKFSHFWGKKLNVRGRNHKISYDILTIFLMVGVPRLQSPEYSCDQSKVAGVKVYLRQT